MRKLLAVLGHPADEERAAVVLVQKDDGVVEALTGEPVTREELRGYLQQAEQYVQNLREACGT